MSGETLIRERLPGEAANSNTFKDPAMLQRLNEISSLPDVLIYDTSTNVINPVKESKYAIN